MDFTFIQKVRYSVNMFTKSNRYSVWVQENVLHRWRWLCKTLNSKEGLGFSSLAPYPYPARTLIFEGSILTPTNSHTHTLILPPPPNSPFLPTSLSLSLSLNTNTHTHTHWPFFVYSLYTSIIPRVQQERGWDLLREREIERERERERGWGHVFTH